MSPAPAAGTIRAVRLVAALFTAAAVLSGCGRTPGRETAAREAPVVAAELASLSDLERERLLAWLFCHECVEQEQDSAQTVMRTRVPVLERILISVPSPWVDGQRQRLERIAAELQLDSATSATYRENYLGNFRATVQSRTLLLLGGIGDSAAVAVLGRAADSAAARGYREDVLRTLSSVKADLASRGLID